LFGFGPGVDAPVVSYLIARIGFGCGGVSSNSAVWESAAKDRIATGDTEEMRGERHPSSNKEPLDAVGALADQGEKFGAGFFFVAEAA
jgi:hypothetical protein